MIDDAERWNRVKQVFQDALEQPAAERALFLRGACGDDRDRRGSGKAVAPNAVWLVRNHDHRNVWSAWSTAQNAVLACKRYRASGLGTTAFEIVPIEVDRDNFARSPWERAVDDLD